MKQSVLQFPLMTTHLDSYPNRIRELRKQHGFSQKELGTKIGVSAVQIGHLELGRRDLSLSMMQKIAAAFDVSTADILSHEDNPIGATPRSRRLITHWQDAEEAGKQAIERVAESMVEFRGPPEPVNLSRMPSQPASQKKEKGQTHPKANAAG